MENEVLDWDSLLVWIYRPTMCNTQSKMECVDVGARMVGFRANHALANAETMANHFSHRARRFER